MPKEMQPKKPQKKQALKLKTPAVKKPERRYRDAVGMARLLPKQLKTSTQKRGFQAGQLILHWDKICPEYSALALPTKLSYAGVLTLTVASDSAKQELLLAAPIIVQRANGFLGHTAVEKIRCQTGVLPAPLKKAVLAPAPSASAVEWAEKTCHTLPQNDLKTALINLGAQIYSKKDKE